MTESKDIHALIKCSFCNREKRENEDFITSDKNPTTFICMPCVCSAWTVISNATSAWTVISNAIATGALIKNPDWKEAQLEQPEEGENNGK